MQRICAFVALCTIGIGVARASADVCVVIDEPRDTLTAAERSAAVLLVSKEFELAGERVTPAPCADMYSLSHIQLGRTIAVTLAGPKGTREARAIGLDDLTAIYNQMVRSVVTGHPMNLMGVVDRTNVSADQAVKPRVGSDNIFYARLGYSGTFADRTYGMPSVGLLGYRHELDSFGIDVSFLNFNLNSGNGSFDGGSGASFQWLKLEGLYFMNPHAERTMYVGGGLAYGGTSLTTGNYYDRTYRSWEGSGLEGALTVGYELPRASTLRVFMQADLGLPFYSLESVQYSSVSSSPSTPPTATTSHHYAPTLTVSVGLGWQRGAHTKP